MNFFISISDLKRKTGLVLSSTNTFSAFDEGFLTRVNDGLSAVCKLEIRTTPVELDAELAEEELLEDC